MNPKETFGTPEERGRFTMMMIDGAKAEMQTGSIKDSGTFIDGSGGYIIYEVAKEADVFASLHKWVPHLSFDVRQVLTLDQLLEMRKGTLSMTSK